MRSLFGVFSKKGNKDQNDQHNLDNLFQDFNNPMQQNSGPFDQFQQRSNINPMTNNYQNYSFGQTYSQTYQQMSPQQSPSNQFNQSWNLPPQPNPIQNINQFPPQQMQIQNQPDLGQGSFTVDERLEQYINSIINEILKDKLNEI
ncbi:MAG: hypothetical protein ACO2OX_04600, partial [Candidatus Nanopusillus sp.]